MTNAKKKAVASGIFDLRNREVWSGDIIASTAPPFSRNIVEMSSGDFGFYTDDGKWVSIKDQRGFYITIENIYDSAPHINKRRGMPGARSWY